MTSQKTPIFDKPHDKPKDYDGLLGWSADWKCYIDQVNKPVPLDDIWSLSPEEESVIVHQGDTLGKIAKEHHCSVDELASFNGITNPALIYPGQTIKIPPKHYAYPEAGDEQGSDQCTLSFSFEDLIEKPIAGLKVKVVSALGDVYESITDGMGKIEDFTIRAETELKVFVSSATGKIKEVASFTPLFGTLDIILSSPKVRVKGKSMALTGPAGHVGNDSTEINKVNTGRDAQGGPRIHISHTCPNKYDLMLLKNVIYWNQIIAASERSGIIPQCIAAVISAEAAKYTGGVWKPTSVCIDSGNTTALETVYKSSAAGMTQFLNGSWMSETFREGTYLYEQANAQGLIADKPALDRNGVERRNRHGEIKYEKKFEVAPDVWKNLNELIRQRFITGKTPYPRGATSAVQQWLNLRFKPEYAIMAAVDYGVANLASLKNAGYNIDGLNDAEKSKLIYLTHHLGLGDAMLFIKNKISEEKATKLLKAQVGRRSAAARCTEEGCYVKAHRKWLIEYIDYNINLFGYFCPELTKSPQLKDVKLEKILDEI
ncbi:LysM peptidoglycan-binding domain-containing protein [Buttiauxella sp. WJP83]|uniref:LysM peptidoglycan-binding domain-containing protein n=1 Tax=Buttiauxella sp. WJP83 TaxID=2986951 RepID=UPI0022DD1B7E|nr:LysM domain-containing protein [Buttiauxella sp. WJP83]WBM71965.1 LysM peptidoglycan-binding domain-containing protein [Buttiauxella sp. WJP83]